MRKILITGGSGFIGSNLRDYLNNSGFDVVSTTRNNPKSPSQVYYDLGNASKVKLLEDIDTIIHCAHDFSVTSAKKNIEGTRLLCRSFYDLHPSGKFIYFSSFSSRPDAETLYGKTKYKIEMALSEFPICIIRPGFVLGNGGLFKKIAYLIKKSPVVPLLDGGKSVLPIISIFKLCECIQTIIFMENKEINLFEDDFVTVKDFFYTITSLLEKRRLFIPISSSLLLLLLKYLEYIGIKFSVGYDNLKAFTINQNVIHDSDIHLFNLNDTTLDEILFPFFKNGNLM